MSPEFRGTPLPSLDVHVKISDGDFSVPGLATSIGGDFANALYLFSKARLDEAIQVTKEEHMLPFVQNRSVTIMARAGLIQVF
jgi:hypothetical protein